MSITYYTGSVSMTPWPFSTSDDQGPPAPLLGVSAPEALRAACRALDVDIERVCGKRKPVALVAKRQAVAWWLCKHFPKTVVARVMNRDRATVLYSERLVRDEMGKRGSVVAEHARALEGMVL